jgi:hypothetical protein
MSERKERKEEEKIFGKSYLLMIRDKNGLRRR